MAWRALLRQTFVALGVAMIVVALVTPELSVAFKLATVALALVIGGAIGLLGDGEDA